MRVNLRSFVPDCLNDFKGVLTLLVLFYDEKLGNFVHCTFIFTLLRNFL